MEHEISAMEFTSPFVVERVGHPEYGRYSSYKEAKMIADQIGDNYFPWPL